ncbi:MAG: ATP-dependent DNA helicase RecG [Lachnospiraceae bacterium]|jgi:ATP-dependent DNA helicase RecG
MELSDNLRKIKGIGEKTEKLLQKLQLYTVEDLLHYYPRGYDSYEAIKDLSALQPDEIAAVYCRLNQTVHVRNTGRQTIITTVVSQGGHRLELIWFHMPFLRSVLKPGGVYIFRGKVSVKNGSYRMEHPAIFSLSDYEKVQNSMQPIYALTAGLTNKFMTKTIHTLLEEIPIQQEYMPEDLRLSCELAEYNYALRQIHFPKTKEDFLLARKRLVFDEFFFFLLAIRQMKERTETAKNSFSIRPVWETEEAMELLPYRLTRAQTQVWQEIECDMTGHTLMSRLVQGDVGSGKTILAFLAMLLASANGYQSAMMAPTEVLAKQHYEALCEMLKRQNLLESYAPVLLTGSLTAKEKRERYKMIADGSCRMIVGTHALIQDPVQYKNLALVITDEQHRFGVRQREIFSEKGGSPHILVMSATPIPRTLAIILYGDLDISVLDELPARRLPIKNCVVDTSYRPKAYQFMERQIREGRQVYVICPMVEESEGLEAENVLDYTKKLKKILPSDINIASLHGRMKAKEKNAVMEAFSRNEIQVLVSTTVIEVGINVPNATVMMVENAERFGLAQLHQLRGRVGRGEHQSYCIFMQGTSQAETSKRLEILNKSNDGFYIAGEDLKLRGPGDLFGIRQSGVMEFQLADIYQDAAILQQASEACNMVLALDEDLSLPQHEGIKEKLSYYNGKQMENPGL